MKYPEDINPFNLVCNIGLYFLISFLYRSSVHTIFLYIFRLLTISPPPPFFFFWSVLVLCIEVFLYVIHTYLQLLCPFQIDPLITVVSFLISCNTFILKYILSDLRLYTLAFFWFLFAWNIFLLVCMCL